MDDLDDDDQMEVRRIIADHENEEEEEEDEEEEPPPAPEVLSKPQAKPNYPFLKDFIARQYDSRRTPWFTNRRIGSLDLVKRMEFGYKLEGHKGCVNALHFNSAGDFLASGSDDRDIIIWEWENKKKALRFASKHESNVFQSKFLRLTGNAHIVSTSRDGQVRLAILRNSEVTTMKLAQHRGSSNKLALLPNSPHNFISCGDDGVLFNIDVREQKPVKLLTQKDGEGGKTISAYTVNANPMDDNLIATAGRDPHIRIYDRRFASESNNQPVKKFCPHSLVSGFYVNKLKLLPWPQVYSPISRRWSKLNLKSEAGYFSSDSDNMQPIFII